MVLCNIKGGLMPWHPSPGKSNTWWIVVNVKGWTRRQNVIHLSGHAPAPFFTQVYFLSFEGGNLLIHRQTNVSSCLSHFIWKQDLPISRVIVCLQEAFRNPLSALWMTYSNRWYFPVKLLIPFMTVQQRPPPNLNLKIQRLSLFPPTLLYPSFPSVTRVF